MKKLDKIPEWYVKLYLKVDAHQKFHLKKGKFYYGELTPTMYDPKTLKEVPKSYVIICDDNNFRKVEASCFLTMEEYREMLINQIL